MCVGAWGVAGDGKGVSMNRRMILTGCLRWSAASYVATVAVGVWIPLGIVVWVVENGDVAKIGTWLIGELESNHDGRPGNGFALKWRVGC